MSNKEERELHWIFDVVRRWWLLIVACALVPAILAFGIASLLPPVYEATVVMMIEPAQDKITNEYSALIAGEQLAVTYSQMVKTDTILQKVIDQIQLNEQPDKLAQKIDVIPINNTQLIQITVKDSTAEGSALLANTVAEVLIDHIQSMQEKKYSDSLDGVQAKINSLTTEIQDGESRRDALNAQIITQSSEIDRLNNLLEQDKANLSNLQQNYHTLQINVTQLTDKVHVVASAATTKLYAQPLYQATTTLLFDQEMISGSSGYVPATGTAQLALTYGPMLSGQPVIQEAADQLGLTEDYATLADKVSFEAVPGTQLIHLYVTDTSEKNAAALADAIAKTFVKQIQAQLAEPYAGRLADIQSQLDTLEKNVEVDQENLQEPSLAKVNAETELTNIEAQLTDYRSDLRSYQQQYDDLFTATTAASDDAVISGPATLPDEPVRNRSLFMVIAGSVGLLAGIGLAFIMDNMNDRVHTPHDISEAVGIHSIASIGKMEKSLNELIMGLPEESHVQEDFHMLGAKLRTMSKDQPLHTILVTSPASEAGKSFVTANLAAEMAKSGLNVIAVDADLRYPRLHQIFGLSQDGSLETALAKDGPEPDLQSTPISGLRVLTSQISGINPAEVFCSPRLPDFFASLKKKADLVLIDCPPMLSVPDTMLLSSIADGILLVLRADHTSTVSIKDAISNLNQYTSRLVGVVLNDIQNNRDGYYRYERHVSTGSKVTAIWGQIKSALKTH